MRDGAKRARSAGRFCVRWCPAGGGRTWLPEVVSHNRTVVSSPPESRCSLSDENCTVCAARLWPCAGHRRRFLLHEEKSGKRGNAKNEAPSADELEAAGGRVRAARCARLELSQDCARTDIEQLDHSGLTAGSHCTAVGAEDAPIRLQEKRAMAQTARLAVILSQRRSVCADAEERKWAARGAPSLGSG